MSIVGASNPSPVWVPTPAYITNHTAILAARLVLLLAFLLTWQFATTQNVEFWTSRPSEIVMQLMSWVFDGSIWGHLGATLEAMILGYAVGCATGIVAGLLLGYFPHVARVTEPYFSAFYALPKIALAPLFIFLFGIGIESKVILVAITVFFLVFNGTLDGFRDIDSDLMNALSLMGAATLEVTRKVVLPATLPWIFTAMRISVRYAFTATLLAELIGSNHGLGFLIERSAGEFDSTGAYAAITVVILCSTTITGILGRIENKIGQRER